MTPVTQEFLHDPENGIIGDCQRAVIASLLDLPIAEVPHFLRDANDDAAEYWQRIQLFCRSRGFVYVESEKMPMAWGDDGDLYHEISGPSPRFKGAFHAVVGRNGRVVFDPHPTRDGLAGDPSEWKFAFLVKV